MPTSTWSARVRYAECDQQGIVFNSHYLTWCDEAVTGWFAVTGTDYRALLARGLDTRVVGVTLAWKDSARYGDVVDVECQAARMGRTSFTVASTVRVGAVTCCQVETSYVLVDADGRPTPVPDDLRRAWAPAG